MNALMGCLAFVACQGEIFNVRGRFDLLAAFAIDERHMDYA